MIAACGMVFGIITSAHVLGQLLGKPTVVLYSERQSILDMIGYEDVKLTTGQVMDQDQIERLLPDKQ